MGESSGIMSFWAKVEPAGPGSRPFLAAASMRSGAGRSGQSCFLSLLGDISKRVEALFLFEDEEGTTATLCIAHSAVEHLGREACVISNAQGENQSFFLIAAQLDTIHLEKPRDWDDVVPLNTLALPPLRSFMRKIGEESEPVT